MTFQSIESMTDLKPAFRGNFFLRCESDEPKFTSFRMKSTSKFSQQSHLYESVALAHMIHRNKERMRVGSKTIKTQGEKTVKAKREKTAIERNKKVMKVFFLFPAFKIYQSEANTISSINCAQILTLSHCYGTIDKTDYSAPSHSLAFTGDRLCSNRA